jgi:hypothetical protein
VWLLAKLGLTRSSLVEQHDGLVGLIGQAGIDDAFALDRADEEQIEKAMRRAPRSPKLPPKQLGERHDEDVEFLRMADTVKMRRVHNSMTNALRRICEAAGREIEEGSQPTCLFDALVREYQGTERHLLIEVKTDHEPPMCRMAVGQLFDYRRLHVDRATIDLGVLFPARPSKEALAFLAYVGVKALWFDDGMRNVTGTGDVLLQQRAPRRKK